MRVAAFFLFTLCSSFSSSNAFITRRNTRHVTIEFAKQPKNKKQRLDWIEGVKESIQEVNKELRAQGYIIPVNYPFKTKDQDSFLNQTLTFFSNLYYRVFFHQAAIAYKGKKNEAFITRRNDEIGSFSVYIPDGVPEKLFVELLRKTVINNGVEANIDRDHHVILTHFNRSQDELGYPLFDGLSLSSQTLKDLSHGRDPQSLKHELQALTTKKENELFTDVDRLAANVTGKKYPKGLIHKKKSNIERKQLLGPYLFWWQTIPTTGLRLEQPFWPLTYPFLPHAFPLWEMAPSMGKGVKVFVLDTGMAAFDIIDKPSYKKNQDLQMFGDFLTQNYNLVSSSKSLLNPVEQLIQLIEMHTHESKRDFNRIKKIVPFWIQVYLKNQDNQEVALQPVKDYLLQNGKTDFIQEVDGKKALTSSGQAALNDIRQGEFGFHPKGKDKPNYTLVDLGPPNNKQKAILEFIPTAKVGEEPFNLFSTSSHMLDAQWIAAYTSSHGTHTAGIIGGLLQPNIPKKLNEQSVAQLLKNDSGICGIAPKCDLIMIKVFKSTGHVTNRSIISQGLQQAKNMDAQIVNLSIKIDDQLDTSEDEVSSLKSILEKIPYVAAASGNAHRDLNGNYQADREGYPARFQSVPFDTGAFSFYQDQETNDYKCPIPPFSQYQEGIGPKFVAPGQNILSCGLVSDQKDDSSYVFMGGTSASAPLMSGFNALVLSEFKGIFGPKERSRLLAVYYTSGLRMHDDDDWKKKTLLGALDLRTALFKLHVLKRLKVILAQKIIIYSPGKKSQRLNFEKEFERLTEAIHRVLFGMVNVFAHQQKITASFENNFMGYFNSARKKNIIPKKDIFNSFEKALTFVTNTVLYAADKNAISPVAKADIEKNLDPIVLGEVQQVFKEEIINIFGYLSDVAKRRIQSADVNLK